MDIESVKLQTSSTYIKEPGWRWLYGGREDEIPDIEREIIEKVECLDVVEQNHKEEPKTEKVLIEKMD